MLRPRLIGLVVRLTVALKLVLDARVFGSCLAPSHCHLSICTSTCFQSKLPLSQRKISIVKTVVS